MYLFNCCSFFYINILELLSKLTQYISGVQILVYNFYSIVCQSWNFLSESCIRMVNPRIQYGNISLEWKFMIKYLLSVGNTEQIHEECIL